MQLLSPTIDRSECTAALSEENMGKNRFKNVLPGQLAPLLVCVGVSLWAFMLVCMYLCPCVCLCDVTWKLYTQKIFMWLWRAYPTFLTYLKKYELLIIISERLYIWLTSLALVIAASRRLHENLKEKKKKSYIFSVLAVSYVIICLPLYFSSDYS